MSTTSIKNMPMAEFSSLERDQLRLKTNSSIEGMINSHSNLLDKLSVISSLEDDEDEVPKKIYYVKKQEATPKRVVPHTGQMVYQLLKRSD